MLFGNLKQHTYRLNSGINKNSEMILIVMDILKLLSKVCRPNFTGLVKAT